jgi:hypothetical protein
MSSIIATEADQAQRVTPEPEGNLLVEAVSLLVQRQRETETWLTEQLRQADRSAARVEERYAELEQRLARIEARLSTLGRRLDVDATADQVQLARLREQVARLSNGAAASELAPDSNVVTPKPVDALAAPSYVQPNGTSASRFSASTTNVGAVATVTLAPVAPAPSVTGPPPAVSAVPGPYLTPVGAPAADVGHDATSAIPTSAAATVQPAAASKHGLWHLLGNTPAESFGVLCMGAGAVAVLYAILRQLGLS